MPASRAPPFPTTVGPCASGPGCLSGRAAKPGWPQGSQHTPSCLGSSSDRWLPGTAAPGAELDDTPCHLQELITKVTRDECEAYVAYKPQMGRRYQPGKASIEHMAPTIHKVMKKFEATVRLVTTSCLGTPSMTAQDRARVVEFWIRVAKVSHGTAPGVHPGVLGPAPPFCQLS